MYQDFIKSIVSLKNVSAGAIYLTVTNEKKKPFAKYKEKHETRNWEDYCKLSPHAFRYKAYKYNWLGKKNSLQLKKKIMYKCD